MNYLTTALLRPAPAAQARFLTGHAGRLPDHGGRSHAAAEREAGARGWSTNSKFATWPTRDPNMHYALLTDMPDSARAARTTTTRWSILPCKPDRRSSTRNMPPSKGGIFASAPSPSRLQPARGRVDGLGAQARQAARSEQLAPRRVRRFPVKVGAVSMLLAGSATSSLSIPTPQLPRGTAQRLIGAIAHPLEPGDRRSATAKIVIAGYGILQPRIGISVQSASRSRLARIYSGQTGFDIYTRAVSDVYQDLYGEGIFTGKGIYEVETPSARCWSAASRAMRCSATT